MRSFIILAVLIYLWATWIRLKSISVVLISWWINYLKKEASNRMICLNSLLLLIFKYHC